MGRLKGGEHGRMPGEDVAVARRRWRWRTPPWKRQPVPPHGWNDPDYAPPDLLEQARADPSAAGHRPCCWCDRCVVRARARGGTPMDAITCARLHDGQH